MALPAQVRHVPAGGGIDESTRPELVEPGASALALENVRADERGGYTKRLGVTQLGVTRLDATTRTAGRKVFDHDGKVCTVDGTHLDVYSEETARWSVAGRLPEATARTLDAPASSKLLLWAYEDAAYCNGFFVFCVDRYVAVMDEAGVVVRAVEAVHSASSTSRVASYGTTAVVVFAESGTANVRAYTLDCSTPAGLTTGWVDRGNVATDKSTASTHVAAHGLSNKVAIAYIRSSGTDRVNVKTVDTTGALQSQSVNTNSTTPTAVSVEGSSTDTLWVAWNEATNVNLRGLNPSNITATALATTTTLLTLSLAPVLSTDLVLCSSATAGAGRIGCNDGSADRVIFRNWTTSGVAVAGSGAQQTVFNLNVASRLARYNGRYYAMCLSGSVASLVLCDVTDNATSVRPVAVVEPGLASPVTSFYRPSLFFGSMATRLYTSLPVRRSGATWTTSLLLEVDFASSQRFQTTRHANTTFVSGGIVCAFDGFRLREASFLTSPTKPSVNTGAGSLSPSVGYRWVAVYETCDGDGNWIPSGVSPVSDLSGTTASRQYTIATRPYTMGYSTDCRIHFYRTLDGGSVYYYVNSVTNDPSTATNSFTDDNSDATISANQRLYGTGVLPGTNGAGQDRRAPPGFSCMVSYNDMLVGASGASVWFSGQNVIGEGTWFNPLFRFDVAEGGDVTALACQDGTLFIFKRDRVFAVAGEAPSDNGAAGGFGAARRLAVDAGCINPRSVVVTSLGIFFQSSRGIELLTRGQSVEWIGEPVQESLGTKSVFAATLDEAKAIVRFEVATDSFGSAAPTGTCLVFDLTLKVWISVDKVAGTAGQLASASGQSACMGYLSGAWRYVRLDTNGVVYYERAATDAKAHRDEDAWVTMKWETPSFKLGLQQEQRLWSAMLLFEQHSACGLQVEEAYGYGSYETPKSWTEAQVLAGARQLEVRPKPRGQATRFRFTDTAPAVPGTGKGCTWIGLSVNTAAKQGSTTGTPRLDPTLRK